MRCPYCSAEQGRCATSTSGRPITECTSCGRVVEERLTQSHHLFHTRAQDSPLCLVTSDLPTLPVSATNADEDPFESTGFITAFSTWSLEPYPVFAQSSISFGGQLAELERLLETTSSSSSSSSVVVENLRAYLQIIDVASILRLDYDISDHAFQLFRDCSSSTCLRNQSVEALATAALVHAIREAQEPRTLQEISVAANLPLKEIGKYIKILGEANQGPVGPLPGVAESTVSPIRLNVAEGGGSSDPDAPSPAREILLPIPAGVNLLRTMNETIVNLEDLLRPAEKAQLREADNMVLFSTMARTAFKDLIYLFEAMSRVRELNAGLAPLREENEELRAKLASLKELVEVSRRREAEIDGLKQMASRAEAACFAAEGELADLKGQLAREKAAHVQTRQELLDAQNTILDKQQQLENATEDFNRCRREHAAEIHRLVTELKEAADSRQLLDSAVIEQNNEVRAYRVELQHEREAAAAREEFLEKQRLYAIMETQLRTLRTASVQGFDFPGEIAKAADQARIAAAACFAPGDDSETE